MKRTFPFLLMLVCLTTATLGQDGGVRPSVSVVGEADMQIEPDEVDFTLEVVTVEKELAVAKRANDTVSARTLAAAKTFGILPDDIQTNKLTISPRYTGEKDPRGAHVLIGYEVSKSIDITLKDLSKIDTFLSRVIEAGVNRVVNVEITNSQYQKYQEQTRSIAVADARNRAVAYAKQLNQSVGKAYVIREEEADNPSYYSNGTGNGNGNGVGDGDLDTGTLKAPIAFGSQVTFALGKISVSEKIYVTFELLR